MQSSMIPNPFNNTLSILTADRLASLHQMLNELHNDQLCILLTKHLHNTMVPASFQHWTRAQLLQQSYKLLQTSFSPDLEQSLSSMRPRRPSLDFYQQPPPPPTYMVTPFDQPPVSRAPSHYAQPETVFRPEALQRVASSPALSSHVQASQPSAYTSQSITNLNTQNMPYSSYISSLVHHRELLRHSPPPTVSHPAGFSSPGASRPSFTVFPPSAATSGLSAPPPLAPIMQALPPTKKKITHKPLPFYRAISCVFERYNVFQFDSYRRQYHSHDEFLLSLDACNQLALSYDYDPSSNVHRTSKCLLLRFARLDQPPMFNGRYDDNLPPNLVIHVNGHNLTNLPVPKLSTRPHTDLLRPGREVDLTPYCMFNPVLKNELTIAWSYREDNASVIEQYANAQYALHIFLAERLSVSALCAQIERKPVQFTRADLVNLLAKTRVDDYDLEISDQKIKLTCPIDQRRMRKPARATTCQHLQCFDLVNYIALNEATPKWICPVCNKPAPFDHLRIDTYMETILKAAPHQAVTEIVVNGDLCWMPVLQSNAQDEPSSSRSHASSSTETILIDDD